MNWTLSFNRLKERTIKALRFLFEDKEMRGDRFDDLKCSKSGALWVDIKDIHASVSYKKAREQSDRVLGIKPHIHLEN
jgi:sugar lactone lactonase YvrE